MPDTGPSREPRPPAGSRSSSAADVARVVDRMAHEILEKSGGAADVVAGRHPDPRQSPSPAGSAARVTAF